MKFLLNGKKGEKRLLLGNEAIARGALEAGVKFISCYPGTPSSEVPDTFSYLRNICEKDVHIPYRMEYSINEKVAMEVACGAALAGDMSLVTMKHVGLNVAADPLFTSAYIGMPGGLVILSADDPGCHSSQNEQDNRQYARFANLPCFEPVSAQEAMEMTRSAFIIAQELQQPVMLRSTTRVSHMRGQVVFGDLSESKKIPFERQPGRFVPVPAVALKRHHEMLKQIDKAREIAENSQFNNINYPLGKKVGDSCEYGIISSGVARNYLADALSTLNTAKDIAVLELGQTWPLPEKLISSFLRICKKILILEEGAPLLEKDVRALAQSMNIDVKIEGKDQHLTEFGEYSTSLVLNRLTRWLNIDIPQNKERDNIKNLPGRPPNLCPGCAHRSVYFAARKVFGDNVIFASDIGCYTLGLLPPLKTADFLVCMGSSVSAGSGFTSASEKPVVGFIGDSTFFHSGLTGLANAIFNKHNLLLVILDNGTTAMTGHQPNPGMKQEVLGDTSVHLDIESIVKAMGVTQCTTVKSNNLSSVTRAFEEMRDLQGVRVIIAKDPCLLYARRTLGKKKTHVAQVIKQGEDAERCVNELACPAFVRNDGKIKVDENLCGGCMLCLQIAPGTFASKKII